MKKSSDIKRPVLLWALFLSSLIGIVLGYQNIVSFASPAVWLSTTFVWISFFTELTNTIVVIMTGSLLWGNGRLATWFKKPAVQSAVCLYIAFVGFGYWFLLGGPENLVRIVDWIRDLSYHTLSPILGIVYWVTGVPKGQLKWHHPVTWLAYPLAYLIYSLFRGPLVGSYPYFFVDVNALGYAGVARWSGLLLIALLFLGSVMYGIDRLSASTTAGHTLEKQA